MEMNFINFKISCEDIPVLNEDTCKVTVKIYQFSDKHKKIPDAGFVKPPLERTSFSKGRLFFHVGRPP